MANIAVLGWGSLLWDDSPKFADFNSRIGDWTEGGPSLPLEFSRVSKSRQGALTLVIDPDAGTRCAVAFASISSDDQASAEELLASREGCPSRSIGSLKKGSTPSRDEDTAEISRWLKESDFDGVVWTALTSNFAHKSAPQSSFTPEAALAHLKSLTETARDHAIEYILRSPGFVDTEFKRLIQASKNRFPV